MYGINVEPTRLFCLCALGSMLLGEIDVSPLFSSSFYIFSGKVRVSVLSHIYGAFARSHHHFGLFLVDRVFVPVHHANGGY